MGPRVAALASALTFALLGCQPALQEGYFRCGASGECPSSWVCRGDGRCWSTPGDEDAGMDAGSDAGVDTRDAGADAAADVDACVPATDLLDVLIVMDDSGSMLEEQASLFASISRLFAGVVRSADVRLGVVSTDLGTAGYTVGTCADAAVGQDAVLQTTPGVNAPAECAASYPSFLRYAPGDDVAAFATAAGCVASLGASGCGYEQPLEAGLKAVTPSSSSLRFEQPGSREGQGDRANAGFLREGSVLLVLYFTDEEDCSVAVPEVLDPDSAIYPAAFNVRCVEYPETLHPVQRYVDGLLALRPPERLALMAIAGVPLEVETAGYETILAHPDMVLREDPASAGRLVPSCDNPGRGFAFPPRRLVELARDLEGAGAATVVRSICQDDLSDPIVAIREALATRLAGTCD